MYMQHKYMVYGEFHIHHYLVLDQSANDNAYPIPLIHGVCNVGHKMVILGIDLCYNAFLHLFVLHQHFPENDTVSLFISLRESFIILTWTWYLYIFFSWIIFCIWPDQWHHFCGALLSDGVDIPELNLHHIFGCQCAFAPVNQIFMIQEVEQWT